MNIFVVVNQDFQPEAAFYNKSEAVNYCISEVNFWDLPEIHGSDWEEFYNIYEVKLV